MRLRIRREFRWYVDKGGGLCQEGRQHAELVLFGIFVLNTTSRLVVTHSKCCKVVITPARKFRNYEGVHIPPGASFLIERFCDDVPYFEGLIWTP